MQLKEHRTKNLPKGGEGIDGAVEGRPLGSGEPVSCPFGVGEIKALFD